MINANAVVNGLGPDVRVVAGGRARRRRRRGRARVPDRRRGHGRQRAVGGDRGADGHRPRGADGAARRDRRAGRVDRPLVPDVGAGRRPGGDDRGRPRRLRAPGRGAAEARDRRAPRARATRPSRGWSATACRRRSRPRTRCAPSSSTRRTWSPSPRATDRSIEDVARVFFALGAELRLDWMERELAPRPVGDADAAVGAAGGPRGRLQGTPRARRGRAAASPGADPVVAVRALPARRTPPAPGGSTPSCARWRARASPTSPASRWRCASSARS